MQLEIPTSELDKIQLDNTKVEQCKMQMLIIWQDLKEGSWSDIVRALVNIGKKYLAARIAKNMVKPYIHNIHVHINYMIIPIKVSLCHSLEIVTV